METIGRDLNEMQRGPLADSRVAALRAAGTLALYPAGKVVVQPGDRVDRFVYILDGDDRREAEHGVALGHGRTRQ